MDEATFVALISVIALVVIALGSIIGPFIQDHLGREAKKKDHRMEKEEEIFGFLLEDIEAFYSSSTDEDTMEQKQEFVENYRFLWLYSTDEVIRSFNQLLIEMGSHQNTESPPNNALRTSMLEMRKRMVKDTELESKDFLIISVSS